MAGAMKKMAVYLGLVEDQYDEYAELRRRRPQAADAYEQAAAAAAGRSRRASRPRARPRRSPRCRRARRRHRRPRRRRSACRTTTGSRRCTRAPTTTRRPSASSSARARPVIMNLTEMEDADAKRIVDFAAGLVFGQRGTLERVTNKVFLLSPANVDVGAETKARIAEGGFFNQS